MDNYEFNADQAFRRAYRKVYPVRSFFKGVFNTLGLVATIILFAVLIVAVLVLIFGYFSLLWYALMMYFGFVPNILNWY